MKNLKKILATTLSIAMVATIMAGCTSDEKYVAPEVMENGVVLESGDQIAVIDIKDYGEIHIKMLPDAAPKAVENFVTHSKNGYYENLTFHRVSPDFVIQGGDPNADGSGGESIWGEYFDNEVSDNYRHYTGALSMANVALDTNGSQFFIVNAPSVSAGAMQDITDKLGTIYTDEQITKYVELGGAPWLDNLYSIFGMTFSGMDVVSEIMELPIDENETPIDTEVTIKSIKIYDYE